MLRLAILLAVVTASACVVTPRDDEGARQGEIAGGRDVAEGELPWMVALIRRGVVAEGFGVGFLGNAVLIGPRTVLTTSDAVVRQRILDLRVVRRTRMSDARPGLESDASDEVRKVTRFLQRPAFGARESIVTLIELDRDLPGPYLEVAAPEREDEILANARSLFAAGWGSTASYGSLSDVLRRVRLPRVSQEACAAAARAAKREIDRFVVCAGGRAGDVCTFDRGAPLVAVQPDGSPVLVGLAAPSFSPGCGIRGEPQPFERIAPSAGWVEGCAKGATSCRRPSVCLIDGYCAASGRYLTAKVDDHEGSGSSPERCLARAEEYFRWCRNDRLNYVTASHLSAEGTQRAFFPRCRVTGNCAKGDERIGTFADPASNQNAAGCFSRLAESERICGPQSRLHAVFETARASTWSGPPK